MKTYAFKSLYGYNPTIREGKIIGTRLHRSGLPDHEARARGQEGWGQRRGRGERSLEAGVIREAVARFSVTVGGQQAQLQPQRPF